MSDNDQLGIVASEVTTPSAAAQQAATAAHTGQGSTTLNAPLPRPARRRRKARGDRGLPPDAELQRLAESYLNSQRKMWPELFQHGFLPELSDDVLDAMVADFKARHRGRVPDTDALARVRRACGKLAGVYCRYSCDNSSTNSILDQLTKCLEKARAENRFIPWEYIYADYSVSGRDSSRVGYSAYKSVLEAPDQGIETSYIDDFTRASRDEIEWWTLAALVKRLGRRLVGASDGFNLSDPNSELMITIYGLVSRLFLKGLREKVLRGMRGAARRGTVLGKLPLGFTRQPQLDDRGHVVRRPDGRARHVPCIDPQSSQHRRRLYELYVSRGWSVHRIAREFNRQAVDGSSGWTGSAVRKLLWSPSAIGVFIFNRTRREFDLESQSWQVVPNPRGEWEVYRDPELALVPLEIWRAARRRLAVSRRKSPLTGRTLSRNQNSASTLFSGTLFCECCLENGLDNAELKLTRSAGDYRQMGCLNAAMRAHGCQLTSSKSVRIIEESLLVYLREALLTEESVSALVHRANEYLVEQARKPEVEIAPLQRRTRKIESTIEGLVRRVEEKLGDPVCDEYEKRIRQLKAELSPLRDQLRDAQHRNSRRDVQSLDLGRVQTYLADLRGLLNQETAAAAEAIRTLTGPIRIRQEPIPGRKRGARWIATFTPDLVRLLRRIARDDGYPEALVLSAVPAVTGEPVEVEIHKVPQYERLAPEFQRLQANGASILTIAAAHGMTWQTAKQILEFAQTGRRPQWTLGKRTGTGRSTGQYQLVSAEVVTLRDEQQMSFTKIAQQLGIGVGTVRRAYDFAHQADTQVAAQRGETPRRGTYSHLGPEVYRQIRVLLRSGQSVKQIASALGCGASTVVRERRRMASDRYASG